VEKLLEVKQLTKKFGEVVAADAISFDVRKGEIHCLLGENGAGKSTLTECIYGYYHPDEGTILIENEVVKIKSPNDAITKGIGMVHQHFVLVQPLSVIENIIVGTPAATLRLNKNKTVKKFNKLCENYDLDIDANSIIWDLSVGQQQWVEILKALYMDARLLILDEPTAVLTPQESEKLFKILRQMTHEGISIVLISHKLNEVMQSDRVTVLRKGKYVATVDTKSASKQSLTNMMVGREVIFKVDKEEIPVGKPMLEVKDISIKADWGGDLLSQVSLSVHQHEILGIAGVAGNGQKELFEALVGVLKPNSGHIFVDGTEITSAQPQEIMDMGVGHIPQDRYKEGLIGEFSIAENLILGMQRNPQYSTGWFLQKKKIQAFAKKCLKAFDISTPSLQTTVNNLSGGNAQKVILARELWQSSKVLLANRPTRGLDVGVIEYVHNQLLQMRQEGYAILMASEELEDIFNLADRIAVIFKGKIMGILKTEDASIEEIGLMMAGQQI
jgi:general nucleoside transport system ATP-binding protein